MYKTCNITFFLVSTFHEGFNRLSQKGSAFDNVELRHYVRQKAAILILLTDN